MFELLEKVFLTGLGAMSLSQKRAEELVAEFKEKYKMTEEEGKSFLEKAQKMAREEKERLAGMVETEVRMVLDKVGMVPREEFDALQKRVAELEEKLKSM